MDVFVLVPVFTALIQGLKMYILPAKFALIAALALGIGYSFWAIGVSPDALIFGIVLGLASAGLYDASKPIVAEVKKRV